MFFKTYTVQLDCGHDVKVKNYDNNGKDNLYRQVQEAFKNTECYRCSKLTERPHVIAQGMAS